jgi:hypothetical protein
VHHDGDVKTRRQWLTESWSGLRSPTLFDWSKSDVPKQNCQGYLSEMLASRVHAICFRRTHCAFPFIILSAFEQPGSRM